VTFTDFDAAPAEGAAHDDWVSAEAVDEGFGVDVEVAEVLGDPEQPTRATATAGTRARAAKAESLGIASQCR
jgi:hypothetical protein